MRLYYEITRLDYAEFNKFHFVKTRLKKTVITALVVILFLELFVNRYGFDPIRTIVFAVFFSLYFFIIYVVKLSNTKNVPLSDGVILGFRTLEFDENGVSCSTDSSNTNSKWVVVKSFEEGRNSYYLYVDSNMAYVIPKRVFNSKEEENDIVNYVKSKLESSKLKI